MMIGKGWRIIRRGIRRGPQDAHLLKVKIPTLEVDNGGSVTFGLLQTLERLAHKKKERCWGLGF